MVATTPEPSLPAIHALHLVEVAERWRVARAALLDGLGLDAADLADPHRRIPLGTIEALVARARALTGEPALGVHLGLHMRVSWHGLLGFAAMAAPTVREALALATRYAPTRTDAIGLRVDVGPREAALVIEERAPLGSARDVIVLALMVGLWRIGAALTGRELRGRAELAFPEPAYLRGLIPPAIGVAFAQPEHRLVFDVALLDVPLTMADPAAARQARELCERELEQIDAEGMLIARVRAALAARGGTMPVGALARELAMSVRTLKRRLAEVGTSVTSLVDEQRRGRALALVAAGDLTVDEVAAKVGYSDAANFARAFRRWTGVSPRVYREQGGAGRAEPVAPGSISSAPPRRTADRPASARGSRGSTPTSGRRSARRRG